MVDAVTPFAWMLRNIATGKPYWSEYVCVWDNGPDAEDAASYDKHHEVVAVYAHPPQPLPADVDALVRYLRNQAQRTSDAKRMMSEDKSVRNSDGQSKDLYSWPAPEETREWAAADMLERLAAPQVSEETAAPLNASPPSSCPDTADVEKVAKAIYEEDDPWHKVWPWPDLQEDQGSPERYRHIARAAIAAMQGDARHD